MVERVSRREWIANYQSMADTLSWDRHIKYGTLLRGLDELQQFETPETIRAQHQEALSFMRRLANAFMSCLPNTSHYFEGLFLGSAKAMTLADMVEDIAARGDRFPMSWGYGAVQRTLLAELASSATAMIPHVHKDSQAAEHYGHSPGKERLLHTEIPLEFYSGGLHTESIAKYIHITLSLYKNRT